LDPLAYHVVAENGTESTFNNAYWDNKADGIYVDVVTGKPLFSKKKVADAFVPTLHHSDLFLGKTWKKRDMQNISTFLHLLRKESGYG